MGEESEEGELVHVGTELVDMLFDDVTDLPLRGVLTLGEITVLPASSIEP